MRRIAMLAGLLLGVSAIAASAQTYNDRDNSNQPAYGSPAPLQTDPYNDQYRSQSQDNNQSYNDQYRSGQYDQDQSAQNDQDQQENRTAQNLHRYDQEQGQRSEDQMGRDQEQSDRDRDQADRDQDQSDQERQAYNRYDRNQDQDQDQAYNQGRSRHLPLAARFIPMMRHRLQCRRPDGLPELRKNHARPHAGADDMRFV